MRRRLAIAVGVLLAGPAGAATLQEAWDAAERGSVEVRLAREQVVQTGTLRFQALSVQLPQVLTQWTWVRNEVEIPIPDELLQPQYVFVTQSGQFVPLPDDFVPPSDVDVDRSALPQLQPLETFGGSVTLLQPLLRAQAVPGWQAATGAWRAAQREESRVRQAVRAATARVFFGLHTARAAVEVAQANVEVSRRQLDLARRQVDAGLVARRAVLQAELAVSRAERDRNGAAEQVVVAEQGWRRVVGSDPPADLDLPAPFELPDEALPEDALARRDDLEAAELRVTAARKERTARDLEWAPTVDFFFQENLNLTPSALSPRVDQWRLGLRLDWTIFDGGLRIARSRELRSRVRAAELLVEQRQRMVREEVAVGVERVQRAERTLEAVEREVDLATESLELAERAFEAGSATFLDVESARLALSSALLARISERAERELAAVDLLLAMGVL
ncbi:MAG: TolC family protein [Alphaproteobacteria bacterium]|nr:TolC family protein [Alphaproteobacteria bacterium]